MVHFSFMGVIDASTSSKHYSVFSSVLVSQNFNVWAKCFHAKYLP